MASKIRYTPLEGVVYSLHENSAPVAILDCQLLFDEFIHSPIVKFRLRNDFGRPIDSAVVTIKFYRHKRSRRLLVATKSALGVAYYGLTIRPGDIFGYGMEIPFPSGDIDSVELAVTRIHASGEEPSEGAAFADPSALPAGNEKRPRYAVSPDTPASRIPAQRVEGRGVPSSRGAAPAERRPATPEDEKRRSRWVALIIPVVLLAILVPVALFSGRAFYERGALYRSALAAQEQGDAAGAAAGFIKLGEYKDSQERLYAIGQGAEENRDTGLAMACYRSLSHYSDAGYRFRKWNQAGRLSGGVRHAVALLGDGTVLTASAGDPQTDFGQASLEGWANVTALGAGPFLTVGLAGNGSALAAGEDTQGRTDVGDWRMLSHVAAGANTTVGTGKDGSVRAVGSNDSGQCDTEDFRGVVRCSAGPTHTVALLGMGRARSTVFTGPSSQDYGQTAVDKWTSLVDVSAAASHTLGLRNEGIVVSTAYTGPKSSDYGQCNVKNWRNIVAISATAWHSVGLRQDGTVAATGKNTSGECGVDGWSDILAVFAGDGYTLGLRQDGTVLVAGRFPEGDEEIKAQIAGWKLW